MITNTNVTFNILERIQNEKKMKYSLTGIKVYLSLNIKDFLFRPWQTKNNAEIGN